MEKSAKTLFGLITYEYEVKSLDIHKIAIKNHIISLTLLGSAGYYDRAFKLDL